MPALLIKTEQIIVDINDTCDITTVTMYPNLASAIKNQPPNTSHISFRVVEACYAEEIKIEET